MNRTYLETAICHLSCNFNFMAKIEANKIACFIVIKILREKTNVRKELLK